MLSLIGTPRVSTLMVSDSISDVTEILPLYVLEMAESTGCISKAFYHSSMLMVDDNTSDAMEIVLLYNLRWIN